MSVEGAGGRVMLVAAGDPLLISLQTAVLQRVHLCLCCQEACAPSASIISLLHILTCTVIGPARRQVLDLSCGAGARAGFVPGPAAGPGAGGHWEEK